MSIRLEKRIKEVPKEVLDFIRKEYEAYLKELNETNPREIQIIDKESYYCVSCVFQPEFDNDLLLHGMTMTISKPEDNKKTITLD